MAQEGIFQETWRFFLSIVLFDTEKFGKKYLQKVPRYELVQRCVLMFEEISFDFYQGIVPYAKNFVKILNADREI